METAELSDDATIILGDCLDVLPTLEANSVDAVITDPPYGTIACKWDSVIPFEPMWGQLKRVIKMNGAIALFGSELFSSYLRMSNIKNYKYDWVWLKTTAGNPMIAKKQPLRISENISIFYQSQPTYNRQMTVAKGRIRDQRREPAFGKKSTGTVIGTSGGGYADDYNPSLRTPKNILCFNSVKGKHPTQKPVALLEYLIKTYTNEGETVVDFTAGSGTTGVACLRSGRKFIGIEMDVDYFEIARERLEHELRQGQFSFADDN